MAITRELRDAVASMQAGNEKGFAEVYAQTHNYVYAKAKYIMKSEEDALDLTQETFIQAYRGISSLENADNVYAWLGGIVYRQGMKIFNNRKEVLSGEQQDYIFDEIISGEATPEQSAQQQATADVVKEIIGELPELQRVAVMAFYYDEMKIDEIAQMCACSSNTIKSRLNYAKKFLKTKIEEHEKKHRYKLCAVSPAVLLYAFRGLFAEAEYKMPPQAVQSVYAASCAGVGIQAAAAANISMSNAGTAAAVKTGLALQIGGIAAAVVAAGAIGFGIFHYMNSGQTPPAATQIAESTDSAATTAPAESAAPTASPAAGSPADADSTGEAPTVNGMYAYDNYELTISNAEESDNNTPLDLKIDQKATDYSAADTVTVRGARRENRTIKINEKSDAGNTWDGTLYFMLDGSVIMNADVTSPQGTYTIGGDGGMVILTKAMAEKKIPKNTPAKGSYSYTSGTDATTDGGVILNIKKVGDDTGNPYVKMELELVSAGAQNIDILETNGDYVSMYDGLAAFSGTTSFGANLYGYFYVNDDGSITLSYTCDNISDISWYGAYPDGTDTPIVMKKK